VEDIDRRGEEPRPAACENPGCPKQAKAPGHRLAETQLGAVSTQGSLERIVLDRYAAVRKATAELLGIVGDPVEDAAGIRNLNGRR
jgi:hypothetical protein